MSAALADRAVHSGVLELEPEAPGDVHQVSAVPASKRENRHGAQGTHSGLLDPFLDLEGGGSGRIPTAPLPTVPRYQARVLVRLRPSVLDPAGEAARAAASRLDVDGIASLRIGKAVEIELDAPDEDEARRRLERLSDRLLANPVIEDWSLELQN